MVTEQAAIEPVKLPGISRTVDLLRLDALHPVISGNKWFKLKPYLQQALREGKKGLVSMGGARSNHLHAMAWAARETGLQSIGYVRGELLPNPTLLDCQTWGMELIPTGRSLYRNLTREWLLARHPDFLFVPEGGHGLPGIEGCEDIARAANLSPYNLIVCAVGTGTMFGGLARTLREEQHLLGFTAMRGGEYLGEELRTFIPHDRWNLLSRFAGAGFGRADAELLQFMGDFEVLNGIPLDRVYTGKMMLGIQTLLHEAGIERDLSILAIHSGGLQGNRA